MSPKGFEQPHPDDLSLELALVMNHSFPQCTFPVLDVSNIVFAFLHCDWSFTLSMMNCPLKELLVGTWFFYIMYALHWMAFLRVLVGTSWSHNPPALLAHRNTVYIDKTNVSYHLQLWLWFLGLRLLDLYVLWQLNPRKHFCRYSCEKQKQKQNRVP